jgi:hypothetical protein
MERAALRAECRRLTKYLRLIDIMQGDLLRTMVQEMMMQLAACVESTASDLEPKVEYEESSLKVLSLRRQGNGWKSPAFRIFLDFKDDEDIPAESAIIVTPTMDQLSLAINDVIKGALEVTGSLGKVFSSPVLEMYVMPDGENGGEDEDDEGESADFDTVIRASPFYVQCKVPHTPFISFTSFTSFASNSIPRKR